MWLTRLLQTQTFLYTKFREIVWNLSHVIWAWRLLERNPPFWQWNDSFPLSAASKEASFGRGTEILFQSVFNSGLILLSRVATLNMVSHYRKPDLRDWLFEVDLSYPSFLLRCLSRRRLCFGADGIGRPVHDLEGLLSVSDVLNENSAVKYPRRQI